MSATRGIVAVIAALAAACSSAGRGGEGSCSTGDDCGPGEGCVEGECVPETPDGGGADGGADGDGDADADVDGDVDGDSDGGGDATDDADGETDPCGGGCPAGQACREEGCVEDCRLADASPCPVETLCSPLRGQCVAPGEECTPADAFVSCGTAPSAPTCGPGSLCDDGACVPSPGCGSVVCDASFICRGVDCAGGSGAIAGISLDPVPDSPRGLARGLRATATVDGAELCGLTVTFEVAVETALYTTAGNDEAIWEVDLETGAAEAYVEGIPLVYGLAMDSAGTLYALSGETCEVLRVVGAPGARALELVAEAPVGCSRLALGPDGALYVPAIRAVFRVDLFSTERTLYGFMPDGIAAWGMTFATGLVFGDDGTLVLGEHWRGLVAMPPGGGDGVLYAEAPARGLGASDEPWNEGMAFDAGGLLHVGVFPTNPEAGFVYRVEADLSTTVLVDLAALEVAIASTRYAGVHGLSFGLDGSMYFTNQNTRRNTGEPDGQLIVQRPDGTLALVAEGFNFDWPRGYDGDLIVGTRVVSSVAAPVSTDGSTYADLDVPDVDGFFQVRVLATDPVTGHVLAARRAARTLEP